MKINIKLFVFQNQTMYISTMNFTNTQNDMETLENTISILKAGRTLAQLKKEEPKKYYTVKGLASKLSALKAEQSGNFITKADLVEYKGLIIFLMNKKSNYRGNLNLKSAMTILLNRIEKTNVVYKTKKGIKGIISDLAIRAGLEDSENNLRAANGFDATKNSYGNSILESFQQFRIDALMN